MREPFSFGRYWLLDRIAVGGMAEVFVAVRRDGTGGRPLAVKRMLPTLAGDAELLTMFLDEARLVAQLDHPGIVPIHELGKVRGSYFIAMDYVPGRDLRALSARLRARGELLPVSLVAYIGCRVADALDHAHHKCGADGEPLRIVHRDVSPANVLLGFDGLVRVIDFGIAEASIRTRRRAGVLQGKFAYMSPEMVSGRPVDGRSDVFALGIVLHELLTGERLFSAGSELAVMDRVRRAEVPSPSERNKAVPEALSAIVLRALARDPDARWSSASKLRDVLFPWTFVGAPPGEAKGLALLLASHFSTELRAESDRVERLEALPRSPYPSTTDEPTRVVAFPPMKGRGVIPLPRLSRRTQAPGPARRADQRPRRRAVVAAASLFVLLATGSALVLTRSAPAAEARAGEARLVVQATSPARLLVDGVPRSPPLEAGEVRALTVTPGPHRIDLRTDDGRRAEATVVAREGATEELLAVELQ